MTEPLYQFYDKDSDTLLYSKSSSEASNSSDQMEEEDDNSREDDDDEEEEEEKSGEENMYESVENLLSLPSIGASLRKTRASRCSYPCPSCAIGFPYHLHLPRSHSLDLSVVISGAPPWTSSSQRQVGGVCGRNCQR